MPKKQNTTTQLKLQKLFPETCAHSVYIKDQNLGGDVMLLIHKEFKHMSITDLDKNSESVWFNSFVQNSFTMLQPNGTCENFQLFNGKLVQIRNKHLGKKTHTLRCMFEEISTSNIFTAQTGSTNQAQRCVRQMENFD